MNDIMTLATADTQSDGGKYFIWSKITDNLLVISTY